MPVILVYSMSYTSPPLVVSEHPDSLSYCYTQDLEGLLGGCHCGVGVLQVDSFMPLDLEEKIFEVKVVTPSRLDHVDAHHSVIFRALDLDRRVRWDTTVPGIDSLHRSAFVNVRFLFDL